MEKSAVMDRVTQNIQKQLDRRGWTHEDLADALGQQRQAVSRMLRGENSPRLVYLERIAEAMELDVAVFFRPVREKVPA